MNKILDAISTIVVVISAFLFVMALSIISLVCSCLPIAILVGVIIITLRLLGVHI